MPALRRDDGQTAAEYLGVVLLVAAVLGVVAATDIGPLVSDGIRAALCTIFDIGCDVPTTTSWEPDGTCRVGRDEKSGRLGGRITFVDLGNGQAFRVDEMSDGTFEVMWIDNGEVGASAKAEAGGSVAIGTTEVGLEGTAEIGALLVAETGEKRRFASEDAAAQYVQDRLVDEGLAALPPGVEELAQGGRWLLEELTGHDRDEGELVETYGQSGLEVTGALSGTAGPVSAEVAGALGGDVRYVRGADGSITAMFIADAELKGKIGLELVAEAGRSEEARTLVAYEVDEDGEPVSLSTTEIRTGAAAVTFIDSADDLVDNVTDLEMLKGSLGGEEGEQIVTEYELDLTDPGNRAVVDGFFGALPSLTDPLGDPGDLRSAGGELSRRLRQEGTLAITQYDTDTFTIAADAKLSLGPGIGLEAEGVAASQTLSGAWYLDRDRDGFVPWDRCVG